MFNILSYVGMNVQSEVCLWTLLGLVRTIFDATLFKVNANLKQVWQMTMPPELSMPVQRILRTMISGVMLVQCFTVYVYLAAYIVLLYPIFLEERPTLVLPWLLLAAIRKLLCELTSLTLGLGVCLLLGPARSPCIKFVILKVVSIMPAFYMWMLVYSFYNTLKVSAAFKKLTAGSTRNDPDYGLELAVRRRRTKSLLGEDQLRIKLVASLYGERNSSVTEETSVGRPRNEINSSMVHSTDTVNNDMKANSEVMNPKSVNPNKLPDSGSYEDCLGSDVLIPRDTDRILEQFVLMMLRIGVHLNKEGIKTLTSMSHILASRSVTESIPRDTFQRLDPAQVEVNTSPLVASNNKNPVSYLKEYPQIFMKKVSEVQLPILEETIIIHSQSQEDENNIDKGINNEVMYNRNDLKVTKRQKFKNVANDKILPSSSSAKNYKNKIKHADVQNNDGIRDDNKKYNPTTLKPSSESCLTSEFNSIARNLTDEMKQEKIISNTIMKQSDESDNCTTIITNNPDSYIDSSEKVLPDEVIKRKKNSETNNYNNSKNTDIDFTEMAPDSILEADSEVSARFSTVESSNQVKNKNIDETNSKNISKKTNNLSCSCFEIYSKSVQKDSTNETIQDSHSINYTDAHFNRTDNSSRTTESCSCLNLHSKSTESMELIIQRMKKRITESKKMFQ